MPYISHTLNSFSHSHIIGRTDPITGDYAKENDKVVFCVVCKSCFLEESWVYMNERHCEQNRTLSSVPALPSTLVFKTRDEKLISEIKTSDIDLNIVVPAFILTFIISFFGLITLDVSIGVSFIITLFVSGFGGVFSAILTLTEGFRKFIGNYKSDVRIFNNRIEIEKHSFLWNDIKQIKYQRKINIDLPILLIYFKNGQFLTKTLPIKTSNQAETFLKALEKVSPFVEVFFYSENAYELRTMKNIQAQSKSNIQVEGRSSVEENREIEARERQTRQTTTRHPESVDYYGRFLNPRR